MMSKAELAKTMKLYAVTDTYWLDGRTLAECVEEALAGGATFIQLRDKNASTEELAQQARELAPICREYGVSLVINDDVDAALAAGVDGVHVGQSDLACAEARKILGPDAIIGVSAQTVEQAKQAVAAGADYLGVGAMIPTSTKEDAEIVTPEELAAICTEVDVPVVAIGGLNAETMDVLRGTGVDGVAVVSALFAANDIKQAAEELTARIEEVLEEN